MLLNATPITLIKLPKLVDTGVPTPPTVSSGIL